MASDSSELHQSFNLKIQKDQYNVPVRGKEHTDNLAWPSGYKKVKPWIYLLFKKSRDCSVITNSGHWKHQKGCKSEDSKSPGRQCCWIAQHKIIQPAVVSTCTFCRYFSKVQFLKFWQTLYCNIIYIQENMYLQLYSSLNLCKVNSFILQQLHL